MLILGMPNQNNMNMQGGPPRGPPTPQMGPGPNNIGNLQQMPAPHVNPAFFNQNSGKIQSFSTSLRSRENRMLDINQTYCKSLGPPQHHPHGPPNSGGMNQPPQNMPPGK